ncbi:hypothetical protein BDY24DRAFT_51728 [Mrakia frigida]|uniref:uncharacterized protein n=1 Tax=Mrakia frigida TaxID=29902 RepID=UPI003FCC1245
MGAAAVARVQRIQIPTLLPPSSQAPFPPSPGLSRKYSFDDLYSTASTLVLDRFIFEENFILYHKAPYPVSIYQDPLYYQGETPDPVHPSRSLPLLIGFLTLVREFNLEEKKKGVIGRVFYCIVLRYSPDFDGLTRVTGGKATDGWKTSLDANDVFTLLRLQSFLLDEQSRLLNEKACPRIFKKHYACHGNADCEEAALLGWKDQFQNYYDDEEDRATAYGPGEEGTNVYIKHWLKKIAEWDGWGDGEEDVEDGCVQEIYHDWNQRRYNVSSRVAFARRSSFADPSLGCRMFSVREADLFDMRSSH